MAYLGGINSSLAVLAGLRLFGVLPGKSVSTPRSLLSGLDVVALTVLGAANASQAFLNFTVGAQNDRWICGHGFDRITVLDALFTVVDWGCAAVIMSSPELI